MRPFRSKIQVSKSCRNVAKGLASIPHTAVSTSTCHRQAIQLTFGSKPSRWLGWEWSDMPRAIRPESFELSEIWDLTTDPGEFSGRCGLLYLDTTFSGDSEATSRGSCGCFAAVGQEGQTLPPQAPIGSSSRLPLQTPASYGPRIPSYAELVQYRKKKGPRLQQLQQKQGVGRCALASFLQPKASLRSRRLYTERA